MLVNIKFENIFTILYTSATFTKYACTLNNNLPYLLRNTFLDIILGILIYDIIKSIRLDIKEQSHKRKF